MFRAVIVSEDGPVRHASGWKCCFHYMRMYVSYRTVLCRAAVAVCSCDKSVAILVDAELLSLFVCLLFKYMHCCCLLSWSVCMLLLLLFIQEESRMSRSIKYVVDEPSIHARLEWHGFVENYGHYDDEDDIDDESHFLCFSKFCKK